MLRVPRSSKTSGELVVFADDSLCRRVVEPGQSWEKILEGLLNDDCCFDQCMGEEGGWEQNVSKADLVPALLGRSTIPLIKAAEADDDFKNYAIHVTLCHSLILNMLPCHIPGHDESISV